jgi:hypothetical protein
MMLPRSVIERAVRQQLADLDLDSGDFDVAAIVEAFEASDDDERDIQVDNGGGVAESTRLGHHWPGSRKTIGQLAMTIVTRMSERKAS